MSVNILGVDYSINDTTILGLLDKNLTEIPDSVFELVNLIWLNLSCNKLTQIPIEINKLVNLNVLYLGYNELTEINDVSSLVKLEVLDLYHNKLMEIPDLSKLVNLKYLDLEHNKMSSIPWKLCEMMKLEYVDLCNNCIVDDDSVKIFKDLRSKYYKGMDNQKQQPIKMLILPMVII